MEHIQTQLNKLVVRNVQNQHQLQDEHIKQIHERRVVDEHEEDIIQQQRKHVLVQIVQHDIDVQTER